MKNEVCPYWVECPHRPGRLMRIDEETSIHCETCGAEVTLKGDVVPPCSACGRAKP